jgi:hypothetical protein
MSVSVLIRDCVLSSVAPDAVRRVSSIFIFFLSSVKSAALARGSGSDTRGLLPDASLSKAAPVPAAAAIASCVPVNFLFLFFVFCVAERTFFYSKTSFQLKTFIY